MIKYLQERTWQRHCSLASVLVLLSFLPSAAARGVERKPAAPFTPEGWLNASVVQQQLTVRGTVKDAKGEALIGVSVVVKGTQIGSLTDVEGNFSIRVPNAQSVLVFSYVGYVSAERPAVTNSAMAVVLQEQATGLNEVVVIGYGQQKKSTLTGAASTVSGAEILKSPTSNATNALVGRMPGVGAIQRSGQPGANASVINIRGAATYGNSGAIVVVDGIERPDFGDIDPNEIESITVLKDAAMTAVYGIRGANGVIVVTTKAGKEGKPRVSYSGNFSLQTYTGIPKSLDAYSNAFLINEARRNDGLGNEFSADELQKFRDGSDPFFYPDINWFDYVSRDFYSQTQHNVNVSGGTKKIKYFASAGYLFEDGIFKEFESPYGFKTTPSFNRFNFRSNVDINLSDDFKVSVRLGGRMQKRYQPAGPQGSSFSYDNVEGMISRIMQTPSFAYPVFLPDGRIAQNANVGTNIWNPYAVLTRWGTRDDDNNVIESTFNLHYNLSKLVEGLTFRTTVGYDSYYTSTTRRNAVWAAYNIVNRRTQEVMLSSDRPRDEPLSGLNVTYGGTINFNLQSGFNYDRSFGDHNVGGLVLFTRLLTNRSAGAGVFAAPYASQGVVSRVSYNYREKYFVELNAAYNGSENFAPGYQYGFFPAVSAGWTLTNEEFLQNAGALSYLKVRGSYGLVGNDRMDNRFIFRDAFEQNSNGVSNNPPVWSQIGNAVQFGDPGSIRNNPVISQTAHGTPDVTWEKGVKRNIGIESSFFRGALQVNVDLFDETRYDILTRRASGLKTYGLRNEPFLNIGEVYNKGYEVEVNYKGQIGEVEIGLYSQVSFARNEIINRDEPLGMPALRKEQGNRVGQFYGYLTDGFYTSQEDINNSPINTLGTPIPGDLKYRDISGPEGKPDGIINSDDIAPIGYSRLPEYTYSFSPSVTWRNFSFSVLFQGVANVSSDVILTEQNNGQQMYEFQLGRWTPETAATATWPALHARGNGYISYRLNDFILQDASYLKIRNAEFSYKLPAAWLQPLKINSARVFLTGQNLYTWTRFKMYLDPENINVSNTDFSRQSIYPSSRIMNLGVNIQF
ncbi:SusC/RagA family TonB-linked outer membrane protein [Rufibacter quisquiliarum]|uniref:TonB-linked SusC/RagA family outer membrane protein n=1 Tax=Rufibacter quisquiliarum TaxID=1549639 RepID=A0A839GB07_9BACT|nr:TonB-dependent receptor [Rufibacter quisquiliarum]MBA9076112.1 TonB-linked SusC/RagA family outer membrane protein [Rufibacter quisquiliarum]